MVKGHVLYVMGRQKFQLLENIVYACFCIYKYIY